MTLDKAIEVLESFFAKNQAQPGKDIWEASKLGIEALKQLKTIRHAHPAFWTFQLPGETPEETQLAMKLESIKPATPRRRSTLPGEILD